MITGNQRRVILTARMLGVVGRVQREGEVVHIVVARLHDLSDELAGLGEQDDAFPLRDGQGDEFHHGSVGGDPRSLPPPIASPRDIYVELCRDRHIDSIKLKTRNFH